MRDVCDSETCAADTRMHGGQGQGSWRGAVSPPKTVLVQMGSRCYEAAPGGASSLTRGSSPHSGSALGQLQKAPEPHSCALFTGIKQASARRIISQSLYTELLNKFATFTCNPLLCPRKIIPQLHTEQQPTHTQHVK